MGSSGVRLDPTVVHAAALEAVEGLDLVVLDGDGKVPEANVPERLSEAGLATSVAGEIGTDEAAANLATVGVILKHAGGALPLTRYGTINSGADHSAAWADAMEEMAGLPGKAVLTVPAGIETRTAGGLTVPHARSAVELNGATLRCLGADGDAALFENAANDLVAFTIRDGLVLTDTGVADFRIVGAGIHSNVGLNVENLEVNPADAPNVADFFYLRKTDFLRMERVTSYGAGRFLVVESDPGEFTNTQIHVKNVALTSVRTGVYLKQVDKATLVGIDIAKCGAGIILGYDDKRVTHIACHVEDFGFPGLDTGDAYNGMAFHIDGAATFQTEHTYIGCSALLPADNAVEGFGQADQGGSGLIQAHYIDCRAISDLTKPNYRPVRPGSSFKWDGRWPYTTDAPIPSTPYWVDCAVRPAGADVAPVSANLLRLSRVSRAEDLATTGAGTFAVTAGDGTVKGARTLTFTGAKEAYTNATLAVGWHTLLVSGCGPQDVQAYVMDGTSFSVLLSRRFSGLAAGQTFRIPFYVAAAGAHRIGFRSQGAGGAAQVARWELHQGLVTDFTDDPRVSRQVGGTAPSTGTFDVGDQIWRSDPAASSAPGWICTAAPNTFKAMASLGA